MAYREQLEAAAAASEPPPPPVSVAPSGPAADTGVPIVEHDGESHTLH
jgi:hypothetical protein